MLLKSKQKTLVSDEAKKYAPCVVFIDEIDAVGEKRVNGGEYPYASLLENILD
jgi:ATP-dependent Zn protease